MHSNIQTNASTVQFITYSHWSDLDFIFMFLLRFYILQVDVGAQILQGKGQFCGLPHLHITALCRSGYYQLRQLCLLVQSMTVEAARTAAAAFISCQLDYCNSLLYGLLDTLLHRLQSVQNATARTDHWHATQRSYLADIT